MKSDLTDTHSADENVYFVWRSVQYREFVEPWSTNAFFTPKLHIWYSHTTMNSFLPARHTYLIMHRFSSSTLRSYGNEKDRYSVFSHIYQYNYEWTFCLQCTHVHLIMRLFSTSIASAYRHEKDRNSLFSDSKMQI